MRAGDARQRACDLPDVTSENVCGELARRANQGVLGKFAITAMSIIVIACDKRKAFAQGSETTKQSSV
jgi:hypothetical protein